MNSLNMYDKTPFYWKILEHLKVKTIVFKERKKYIICNYCIQHQSPCELSLGLFFILFCVFLFLYKLEKYHMGIDFF